MTRTRGEVKAETKEILNRLKAPAGVRQLIVGALTAQARDWKMSPVEETIVFLFSQLSQTEAPSAGEMAVAE